jgi:L-fuculose-phosphate aldolase
MLVGTVCDVGRLGALPYVTPASPVIAEAVAEAVMSHDTLLLANHGVLGVGSSVKQAFFRVAAMEHAAKAWVAASIVGSPRCFAPEQVDEILSLDTIKYRYEKMGE